LLDHQNNYVEVFKCFSALKCWWQCCKKF